MLQKNKSSLFTFFFQISGIASNVESKTAIMRNWARESVPSAADAISALSKARISVENYEVLLQQQVSVYVSKNIMLMSALSVIKSICEEVIHNLITSSCFHLDNIPR